MDINGIKKIGRQVEQGAWVSDLPDLPGLSVKVRGSGNSDYGALFAKLATEYGAEKLKDEAVQREVDTKLLVETILVDWKGIDDMPYSKENAAKLLDDPELKIFRRAVNFASNNVARLGRESLEDDAKNS